MCYHCTPNIKYSISTNCSFMKLMEWRVQLNTHTHTHMNKKYRRRKAQNEMNRTTTTKTLTSNHGQHRQVSVACVFQECRCRRIKEKFTVSLWKQYAERILAAQIPFLSLRLSCSSHGAAGLKNGFQPSERQKRCKQKSGSLYHKGITNSSEPIEGNSARNKRQKD